MATKKASAKKTAKPPAKRPAGKREQKAVRDRMVAQTVTQAKRRMTSDRAVEARIAHGSYQIAVASVRLLTALEEFGDTPVKLVFAQLCGYLTALSMGASPDQESALVASVDRVIREHMLTRVEAIHLVAQILYNYTDRVVVQEWRGAEATLPYGDDLEDGT